MTNDDQARPAGRGRRALGRGLDTLLPGASPAALREIDIDRIERNPKQPRQTFTQTSLEELAASIKEHGVVQPLVVTAVGDDRYRLIVGERRWRASQLAGLERVPVVVKDMSDRQTLEVALVENVQRADLNPIEEAEAYHRLMDDFGLSQQEVARQVGKSRTAIANTVRLLALPGPLKKAVVAGQISEGHARAMLGAPAGDLQLRALEQVLANGLNVRQTEDLVRRLREQPEAGAPEASRDPNIEALETSLGRALGTRVSLRQSRKGGRIVIEYYSDDEFQYLYDRLTSG